MNPPAGTRVSYARAVEAVGAWLEKALPARPEVARGFARDALKGSLPKPRNEEKHGS